MEKLQFILFSFLFISIQSIAQQGTVRGIMTDANSGETIPFANVLIVETDSGFSTDLDGAFSVTLDSGDYTFQVSYIGYADQTINDIHVTDGQVTLVDIVLSEASETIDEVVIVAKQARNTENALMTIQRKSYNVMDGISSQSFKRIGDGNAAAAIKRVTGVSIQGGKYVFVRGLGDRYTKTTLNGMDIPGLDPDRNSLQMDIFPTNIMDNILVSKSFTPDLPGDFTGGVVNIITKDFPEEKTSNLSVGMSYNPNMHFNSDYITAPGSSTDWLGFDDGKRDLRLHKNQDIPAPISDPMLTTLTSRFSKDMATMRAQSGADMSVSFSLGNQYNFEKSTLGFNAAVNYKNSTEYFEGVEYSNYIKSSIKSENELLADRISSGDLGRNNVLASAMVGGALKFNRHKFSVSGLRIQNGNSTAGFFNRQTFIRNSNTLIRDNIEYQENTITNVLWSATHSLDNDLNINWKISPTISKISDKDIKVSPFRLGDNGELTIEPSEGAQPRRLFRDLDEINLSSRLDIDKKLSIADRIIMVKVGGSYTTKDREYGIINYVVNVKSQNQLDLTGDPNELFLPENIWTPASGNGTYIKGNFEPTNSYNATQNTFGTYAMLNFEVNDKLKATTGLRMEKFDHFYTGQNNTGSTVYDQQKIIEALDFLPALNLIYKMNKDINLRASFSRTLARPSFKEASIAQIYDAISDITFIGNINLQTTDINNYDIRLESYLTGGQMFAVSGFYKSFVNPIELVAFSSAAPQDIQPRNVGDATVLGVELELRKNLTFLSDKLSNLSVGSNVTIVNSDVKLDQSEGGEYDSRNANAREGETIGETRTMQGQAPYIINAYLNYLGSDNGWDANLSYNVQGSSLSVVGIGLNPDVYTVPFHNLSMKISKKFGTDDRLSTSIAVKNILGSDKSSVYRSFGAVDQTYQLFRPFRSYSISLSFRLF